MSAYLAAVMIASGATIASCLAAGVRMALRPASYQTTRTGAGEWRTCDDGADYSMPLGDFRAYQTSQTTRTEETS